VPRKTGFALLTAEKRAELGKKGGKKAQRAGTGHRFTSEEATAAIEKRWGPGPRKKKRKLKKRRRHIAG
jgi:hypothetical protein